MSFDARSLERLKQLGRTLPQPLAPPEPPGPEPPPVTPRPADRRHRVETETDPAALFRELMKVSPDGEVPPHLLDRLRQAEGESLRASLAPTASPALQTATAGAVPCRLPTRRVPSNVTQRRRRDAASDEEQELYTAFQQLLLEGDDPHT